MTVEELAAQVMARSGPAGPDTSGVTRPMPAVVLLRQTSPSALDPTMYEPVVCLILQGRKETFLGDERFEFGPGESLLVTHDVPVNARVTVATPTTPYLALILQLDFALLRSLESELQAPHTADPPPRSVVLQRAPSALIGAFARYLACAADATEARVVGPLILREIHFRLLAAPQGSMLRHLLRHDSHASAISRAIAHLRRDFRAPISVPRLARDIGMSPSTFHKHFKDITSTTPLQYQKDLRLLEARQLLRVAGRAVSTVAFEVGYESPNQFSREYTRKFGAPPRADLAAHLVA